MKRVFDLSLAFLVLIIFFIPIFLVSILVLLSSPGPILFWSNRVGKNNIIFKMPKFRSMKINTPNIATHRLKNPEQYLTPIGSFLRKTSLDELPQIWSIFIGDMSFIGPRPALFNQDDLILLRTKKNIHKLKPGLTGWAQVNGRDNLSVHEKVQLDFYYLKNKSILLDLLIFKMTILNVIKSRGVSH